MANLHHSHSEMSVNNDGGNSDSHTLKCVSIPRVNPCAKDSHSLLHYHHNSFLFYSSVAFVLKFNIHLFYFPNLSS